MVLMNSTFAFLASFFNRKRAKEREGLGTSNSVGQIKDEMQSMSIINYEDDSDEEERSQKKQKIEKDGGEKETSLSAQMVIIQSYEDEDDNISDKTEATALDAASAKPWNSIDHDANSAEPCNPSNRYADKPDAGEVISGVLILLEAYLSSDESAESVLFVPEKESIDQRIEEKMESWKQRYTYIIYIIFIFKAIFEHLLCLTRLFHFQRNDKLEGHDLQRR